MNKLNVFSLTILALLLNSVSQAQITWAFGEYTGNGSASAVTGVGFQADAILIKSEGASQAVIVTSDMTAGDTKPMGSTSAHTTGRITSIDADGFSLGTDAEVNSTGIVYQWMAFEDLAGDDLSVGTYTGTGSSVTISTIGFQPDMIWYWGDGGDIRDDATMYLKSNSEKCDRFRDGYRSTNMIGNLNSSGFTTGGDGTHGRDILGVEYYYIAFDTDGDEFKYGGFTGKSSGSKTITVSWESQFVIVNAAIQNSQPVMRLKSMSGDESLRFHAHAVHTDAITSMTATTFVVGTDHKSA